MNKPCCPYCGSENVRVGDYPMHGDTIYYCNSCHMPFILKNPLTTKYMETPEEQLEKYIRGLEDRIYVLEEKIKELEEKIQ